MEAKFSYNQPTAPILLSEQDWKNPYYWKRWCNHCFCIERMNYICGHKHKVCCKCGEEICEAEKLL